MVDHSKRPYFPKTWKCPETKSYVQSLTLMLTRKSRRSRRKKWQSSSEVTKESFQKSKNITEYVIAGDFWSNVLFRVRKNTWSMTFSRISTKTSMLTPMWKHDSLVIQRYCITSVILAKKILDHHYNKNSYSQNSRRNSRDTHWWCSKSYTSRKGKFL